MDATPKTLVRLHVRPARISDLAPLVSLYLGLSPESRHRFHPFPFRRPVVVICFWALLMAQHLLPPVNRRFPQTLLRVVVAQVDDGPGLAGYGTIRAVHVPNLGPRVRFGFIVAEGFQGHGIGPKIVRRLAETALEHGFEKDIGTVFRSDAVAQRAMARFGASFVETDSREPAAPDEPLFEVHGLLRDKLRLIGADDPILDGAGRVRSR